jgi:hypothetical protein
MTVAAVGDSPAVPIAKSSADHNFFDGLPVRIGSMVAFPTSPRFASSSASPTLAS